jgi:hypothetical protein
LNQAADIGWLVMDRFVIKRKTTSQNVPEEMNWRELDVM